MKEYIIRALDKDADGDVDLADIYLIIADLMTIESSNKQINNINKKINVLAKLKELLGNHYDRFEPMLDPAIDFIFQVAQSNKLLKKLKNKCICFKSNKK